MISKKKCVPYFPAINWAMILFFCMTVGGDLYFKCIIYLYINHMTTAQFIYAL